MWSFIIRTIMATLFCAVVIVWYLIPDRFFVSYSDAHIDTMAQREHVVIKENAQKVAEVEQEEKPKKEIQKEEMKKSIKHTVPFVVQAPHAQWDDARYQDACEEASMIMVNGWAKNDRHISKNAAEKMLEDIFTKEKEYFGDVIDTSVADTARFFAEYYGHDAHVRENVTMEDLYHILASGHVIIAPTNGKMLGNPHFTNGGPERHMLVIIGYNKDNREFITNDPGTRVGRGYKYKDTTLYNAIRDYETGVKKEIKGTRKNIIVVKK